MLYLLRHGEGKWETTAKVTAEGVKLHTTVKEGTWKFNNLAQGKETIYHDGIKKSEVDIVNGVFHGKFLRFSSQEPSQVYHIENFVNGVKHGKSSKFNETDPTFEEMIYIYENGVLRETRQWHFETKNPKANSFYNAAGKPIGKHETFYKDGKINTEDYYDDNTNKRLKKIFYDEEGNIKKQI